MAGSNSPPIGIVFVERCCTSSATSGGGTRMLKTSNNHETRDFRYKAFILFFTFLSYTTYHLSRKPLSVVKTVLNRNCSGLPIPVGQIVTNQTKETWCDWAPFDKQDSNELLGTLDSAFLFSYAIAMFFSGFVAERVNLRYFLSMGMLLSGIFTYLFGLAYVYNIHQLYYYIFVQIAGGIVQSSGWPSVVTCCGNWFGKGRRGLIFGIWNSHTSVGNILGSVIAGLFVDHNWGYSFIVPGAVIGVMGFLTFLFLVVYPSDVGCTPPDYHDVKEYRKLPAMTTHRRRRVTVNENDSPSDSSETSLDEVDDDSPLVYDGDLQPAFGADLFAGTAPALLRHSDRFYVTANPGTLRQIPDEERPILKDETGINTHRQKGHEETKAVSFMQALKIPGVIEFSLCLFFAKLVSYTFLYWLPKYINHSTSLSASDAANLSTLFDVGGIIGGIIAGVISDRTGANATTCSFMLLFAIPSMFIYQEFGGQTLRMNIILLMVVGLLVNGPYALITTAVSAELGTHRSLKGNSKALATVTSIIDGTGSLGAAVGPLLAGVISGRDWSDVFVMLMISDVLAALLLIRLSKCEIRRLLRQRKDKGRHQAA